MKPFLAAVSDDGIKMIIYGCLEHSRGRTWAWSMGDHYGHLYENMKADMYRIGDLRK